MQSTSPVWPVSNTTFFCAALSGLPLLYFDGPATPIAKWPWTASHPFGEERHDQRPARLGIGVGLSRLKPHKLVEKALPKRERENRIKPEPLIESSFSHLGAPGGGGVVGEAVAVIIVSNEKEKHSSDSITSLGVVLCLPIQHSIVCQSGNHGRWIALAVAMALFLLPCSIPAQRQRGVCAGKGGNSGTPPAPRSLLLALFFSIYCIVCEIVEWPFRKAHPPIVYFPLLQNRPMDRARLFQQTRMSRLSTDRCAVFRMTTINRDSRSLPVLKAVRGSYQFDSL